jgi:hypothetical protein
MKPTIAEQLGVTKFPFEIRDKRGNVIYRESLSGYWGKWTYDLQDMEVYYEDSEGQIIDNRPQSDPQPTPTITLQNCLDRGFTVDKIEDEVYKEKHGKDYMLCYLKLSKRHMIDYCNTTYRLMAYKVDLDGNLLDEKDIKTVEELDFYIHFLASEKRLRKLNKQKTIQEVINVMDDFILKQTKN